MDIVFAVTATIFVISLKCVIVWYGLDAASYISRKIG